MATGTQVDLSPSSIQDLAAAVSKAVSGSGGGGGSSSSRPGSIGMDFLGAFKTGVEGATSAIGQLASGSLTVAGAFQQAGKIITGLDPTGLSAPFAAMGNAALGTVSNLNSLSKNTGGLDFAGDVGKFNSASKGMLLTQEETMALYKRYNGSLTGLGSTVNQSAGNFATFQRAFTGTDFSGQLAGLGIGLEEQAELSADYLSNMRFLNLQDEQARQRTIQGFTQFAIQLDENSRLTGMSRKEQTDAVNAQAKNVRVLAAVSQMGEGAMENFKGMQGKIVGLGENVQMAASAIYTGGPKNEQERAAVAALGPAASQFEKAVQMSKDAGNDPAKKALADQEMEIAKQQIIAWQRSKAYTDAVQTGSGAVADAMRTQYEQNKYGPAAQFAVNQAQATGQPTGQAAISEQQRLEAERQRLRVNEKGEQAPGAQFGQTVNVGDKVAREIAGATAPTFDRLNTSVGETILKVDGFGKALDAAGPAGRQRYEAVGKDITDKVYNMVPGTQGNAAENSRMGNLLNRMRPQDTRDLGTFGITGQMFEPMDKIVKISKGEIVLSPEQAQSFAKSMAGGADAGAAGSLPSTPPIAPSPTTPSSAGKDATLNDVLDALNDLNKQMGHVVNHSANTADYTKKQINAIKGVSNNMWA